jgi:hypothetical protein
MNFVRLFLPRQEMLYFYICLDEDPSVDQHLEARSNDQGPML